ncbi:BTB/POZ domain-containing protein At1g63850-like [Silene latifolia]|uniref:BTB/POZ domain-containing protein At1g63850-like n=1 Tax=Silene latifolia TaxID=37657 RepID=UPI003D76DDD0
MQRSPTLKKRQRINTASSSVNATIDPGFNHRDTTAAVSSSLPRRNSFLSPIPGGFNDASTADVLLRLFLEDSDASSSTEDLSDEVQVYLHSSVLCKAKYFSTLLSDRWCKDDRNTVKKMNLGVSHSTGSMRSHLIVLQLLYADDLCAEIVSVSYAVSILHVAVKLLFEDCVKQCLRFLEAVPWNEEEEELIVNLMPILSEDESNELLARVISSRSDSCEQMLHNLLISAKQNHPNVAPVKAFVARLLREFSSRESARRVLENAFMMSLKVVKGSLEEYSSPDFRGDHNETEAIQRLNLHTALTNGKHLMWIVERMIELRVADVAVKEWSEQASFAADLQRAFQDDAWRNIVPGLPTVVLKCTSKLASAVVSGSILVSRQVRMKLVKDWLPVLIVCKDNASPVLPSHKHALHSPMSLYLELEETFLRIISTLPMDDAQELLQQCLSFSTRDSEDCPHLITAFNTWFRRATRPPLPTHLS